MMKTVKNSLLPQRNPMLATRDVVDIAFCEEDLPLTTSKFSREMSTRVLTVDQSVDHTAQMTLL